MSLLLLRNPIKYHFLFDNFNQLYRILLSFFLSFSFQPYKLASQEETPMATTSADIPVTLKWKYSNWVLLKTIFESRDGGLRLANEKVVIGGWVKSSKEVKKEPEAVPPSQADVHGASVASGLNHNKEKEKDVSCVERFPFFRTIIKILGGSARVANNVPLREKLESLVPKPPLPSTVFLQVSDGSCVSNLQVVMESALVAPSKILPIGTCILVEGVLKQPSVEGEHAVELKAEKILHIGTVDDVKYPLSRKRLPIDALRDSAHFRPHTTTVASVMRIRSSLTHATLTFFQNHGFLSVQVPVITTTDSEGFSEKFQVTTLFDKAEKERPKTSKDVDILKAAIKEKSNQVEQLKRSESNKEALNAALQDLRKTNELAAQLESRDKLKQGPFVKLDRVDFSEDFFCCQTYLTVSGRLHLESYACALGSVYSFGPRFRAGKNESSRYVAEMWVVETEIAFSQLEDAIKCADDYFKFLCKWILEDCSNDLEFVSKRIESILSVILSSFEKITYTDAVKVLEKVTEKIFETKLEWGVALTAEHLSYLTDEIYKKPVIVYDYPKAVKPFYVRLNNDGNTMAAFDLVVPKVGTLISGSQNEERIDMLNTRIKELGLPREEYEWYLDLRRHGTVEHSGFSFAFDLMVLFVTGLTDVRDAIPFPRSVGKANN